MKLQAKQAVGPFSHAAHHIALPGSIEQTVELRRWGRGGRRDIAICGSLIAHFSTLKIVADCCQLCQYKLTKPNLTYPNPEE